MLQRATDLAGIALILGATLLVVQAHWEPPTVSPGDAAERVGERVQIEGMTLDVRRFADGGGRLTLASAGSAIHASFRADVTVDDAEWVRATGTIRRDAGMPLFEIDDVQTSTRADLGAIPLATVAVEPGRHLDHRIVVQGHVIGATLADDGFRLRLSGHIPDDGPHALDGVLRYDPTCICHALHVAEARPWTP